jgi:hypothetical protein
MRLIKGLLGGIAPLALTALATIATPTDAEALCLAQEMAGTWRNVSATATIAYVRIDFPCPDTAPSTSEPATMTIWIRCGLPYFCSGQQNISYKFFSESARQFTHVVATFSSDSAYIRETVRSFLLDDGRLWVFREKRYLLNEKDDFSKGDYFIK